MAHIVFIHGIANKPAPEALLRIRRQALAAGDAVQDEIRSRPIGALSDAAAQYEPPHIPASHSIGTVIAYDCLKCVPGCPRVDALMTVGSVALPRTGGRRQFGKPGVRHAEAKQQAGQIPGQRGHPDQAIRTALER
jgi:hypothetical protein